jgi:hypothetical protein
MPVAAVRSSMAQPLVRLASSHACTLSPLLAFAHTSTRSAITDTSASSMTVRPRAGTDHTRPVPSRSFADVAREDATPCGAALAAGDLEARHVRDVEEPRGLTHGPRLGQDPAYSTGIS